MKVPSTGAKGGRGHPRGRLNSNSRASPELINIGLLIKSTMEKKIKLVSTPGETHFHRFRHIFGLKKVQKKITLYEKLVFLEGFGLGDPSQLIRREIL